MNRRALLRSVGAWGGAGVLRASGAVTRLQLLHLEREAAAGKNHESVIYALWHGRMWLLAARFPRRGVGVLVSVITRAPLAAIDTNDANATPVTPTAIR